ncbi:MAG: type IX secretion system membrane protein PorP/SprF [Bacteroidales bacterium]|nr:type IX secretion system membrane protein PorP/SprF [Bacteroidales bacterium]
MKLDIFTAINFSSSNDSVESHSTGMRYLRIIVFAFILVLVSSLSYSQQFPEYSQYMMNSFLLNPAVAGHEGYTSVNLTVKEQWLGLSDAPSTYAVSAQTRLLKNSFISRSKSIRKRRRIMSRSGRVGLGAYIFNDTRGALGKTGFSFTYGYHLTLRRSQLSFGASLTGFQYAIDFDKINPEIKEDLLLLQTDPNAFILDAAFGVYYSDKNLYAGLSAQNLFESLLKLSNRDGSGFVLERQYMAMAGYRVDLMDFLYIEPSFLYKLSENYVGQLDANLRLYVKQDYWAGLSYRTGSYSRISTESIQGRGASLVFMAGARVDKYHLGYAFDYSFSSISARSVGSHELMFAVKFGDSARRYRWLNRY